MKLADSHIHFFQLGYRRNGLPSLLGQHELETYEALRTQYDIGLALGIGYEADGIDPGNNAYLRRLSQSRPWLKTLAYVEPALTPAPDLVEQLLDQGHCGLAIYITTVARTEALLRWPRETWQALEESSAIVSFNARPDAIVMLKPLVSSFPGISFLFSHLGLPGRLDAHSSLENVRHRLAPALALKEFTNTYVKISGLYATSEPEYAYPHSGAHYGVVTLIETFGVPRCLWGSDFAPALEYVSFPQTMNWPGICQFSASERRAIMVENLVQLLSKADTINESEPE